jgi:hypothetical protein
VKCRRSSVATSSTSSRSARAIVVLLNQLRHPGVVSRGQLDRDEVAVGQGA